MVSPSSLVDGLLGGQLGLEVPFLVRVLGNGDAATDFRPEETGLQKMVVPRKMVCSYRGWRVVESIERDLPAALDVLDDNVLEDVRVAVASDRPVGVFAGQVVVQWDVDRQTSLC